MPFLGNAREGLYLAVRHLWRTVKYFLEFLAGDFSGLSKAPVSAKSALKLRQLAITSPIRTAPFPSSEEVFEECRRMHEDLGAWPISFSYPRPARDLTKTPKPVLCPVFPGHRYSFQDETTYMETYAAYSFALTHRKSGWDCFRHVEILAAGSIPFMPDVGLIPPGTMVHYPKKFLHDVSRHLSRARGSVPADVGQELRAYFNQNLTSEAMARYLLRIAAPQGPGPVVFFDEVLGRVPDYQSVLTLVGLKQALGNRVVVPFQVPYVYEDWNGSTQGLYGRGFGYSRVLPESLRSPEESAEGSPGISPRLLEDASLLIVGNVSRNFEGALKLLDLFPASKTVWIDGEDQAPTPEEISRCRDLGVTFFVRELV